MAPTAPELSIVIPCFDEAERIGETLVRTLEHLDRLGVDAEVLAIDDGSRDDTAAVVEAMTRRDERVRLVRQHPNRGKGAAVRRGVAEARGRYVVFYDADLSYGFEHVDAVLEALRAGDPIVVGGRDLAEGGGLETYGWKRKVASRAFNAIVDAVLDLGVPDTQCGLKGFRAEVAKPLFATLHIDRFGFDVEMLHAARLRGLPVSRVAVRMLHRPDSKVRLVGDSARMMWDLLRIRAYAARGDYDRG